MSRIPAGQLDVKLSQVSATMSPIEAERTARALAKGCLGDTLVNKLSAVLHEQDLIVRQLQDAETKVFVLRRAIELDSYRLP